MSNKTTLDDVRKILLACLVSRKGATSLTCLDRDYYEQEQQRVPYRRLGYSTLVDFLRSMPEHFVVEEHNGQNYVHAIASEKSKHVSSLVERQISKRFPRTRQYALAPFNRRVQYNRSQEAKIAPDKLLRLVQHIRNNPNGVSLQSAVAFVNDDSSINISSQELRTQLLTQMHQLLLDGNMIYHKSKDLSYQPVIQNSLYDLESPPTRQTECAAGEESDYVQYCNVDNGFVPANYANSSQRRAEKTKKQFMKFSQYDNCEDVDMSNYMKRSSESNDDFTVNSKSTMGMKTDEYCDLSTLINDKTKSRLEELMQRHPEGILCADLPNVFFNMYKMRLNYTVMGFASVREFTSYLPQIFYMTQINKNDDFMLYSADKRPIVPKTDPIDIMPNRYDKQAQYSNNNNVDDAPIPAEIEEWREYLRTAIQESSVLDPASPDYANCNVCETSVLCCRQRCCRLIHLKGIITDGVNSRENLKSPTITKSFAPNDVMNYGDKIGKIPVTELQQKSFLEVYVVEVFHPNFFWIHLRRNRTDFYEMMDKLTDFYEEKKNTYIIAKVALKKDMNCACIYVNRWHRGIIKSVKPDFRVTVFFYDYGTLKTYAAEDVYYLHKSFSSLPAQAIPCCLHNVTPIVGDRWKKSAVDQFIDKIADTLLAATVITVDPTHNSMMVILTDTTEDEDVIINNWLVKQRLAQVGQMADAVDMASIMKYVQNNLNQLPTYCFAEENLMPDNCCKATSAKQPTEEKHEVPVVSPGPTHLHYDNHHQQHSVRPPPGFPPLSEHVSPNLSATNLYGCSFENIPVLNAQASGFSDAEATTNPFLVDQQFSPNDVAKQMYMTVWNENKKLQIQLTRILEDLLEHSSFSFNDQIQLNKILKIVEQALLEQKEDHSVVTNTSSTTDTTSGTTSNDVGPAQEYILKSETFPKQDINANTFSTTNPFGTNNDDRPQNNIAFPTYNSDSFATAKSNWNQSNELNSSSTSRMQMPPSTIANSVSSMFVNPVPSTSTFLPSTNRNGENVPETPVSSTVPTTNLYNDFSHFLESINNQFTNMLKDTNPFKFSMTDGMQVPETQNEQTSHKYDMSGASYLTVTNPQSHSSKTETPNIHSKSNCFTPAGHLDRNYTSRIVYESGPVMYNTQKKKADVDAKQNTRKSNSDNIQNTQSLELGQDKKPASQPAKDIATSYTQHMINHIKRDNSQAENYVTQPPTYYTQGSQPVVNGESAYYQQNVNNFQPVSSQAWIQNEVSEHWINSKLQNNVPMSNHSVYSTPTTLSHQDWNCDTGRKSIPREMNEATESSFNFTFKDNRDKEGPMYSCTNSWKNIETGPAQQWNAASSFVFRKIDTVKGVTLIFNFAHDGWILTYEFVEAFTNFKLQSRLLAVLEAMNIKVVFKEIQRSEYPAEFSQLDRYPLKVPRDSEKRIISINLISLQTALTLLRKLKIISFEEIDNAFKKNEFLDSSILPTLWYLANEVV